MDKPKLPPGWVWTTLEALAYKINPGFPSGKHNKSNQGVPHLRPMNVAPEGKIDLSEVKYVEVAGYDALQKGDVLFNNTNSPEWVGKTAYIAQDTNWAYSNHMTRIRFFPDSINSAWIAFYLHYLTKTGFFKMNCTHHVNQASINTSFLSTRVSFPLPPLAEQQRIVDEIEAQFTRLDAVAAALKRAQATLKRCRASVLKTACEGRLVPQNPSDEPASQLLERILAERRQQWNGRGPYTEPTPPDTSDLPELPVGWVHTKIEPILSLTRPGIKTGPFGSLLKKHEHQPAGVPVFGIENIQEMKFIPGSKIHITERKAEQLSDYDALPGDILISRSGTVGEVCIIPEGMGEARFSTNIIRVVLTDKGMLAKYFCFLFNGSPFVLDQVSELCSGSTRDFLNKTILSSIIFPLPPLAEQQRIVEEVERRLSVLDEVEASLEANLKRAERLRQAILKRAFAGKLVPQNPADEPAPVLLERIREAKLGLKAGLSLLSGHSTPLNPPCQGGRGRWGCRE